MKEFKEKTLKPYLDNGYKYFTSYTDEERYITLTKNVNQYIRIDIDFSFTEDEEGPKLKYTPTKSLHFNNSKIDFDPLDNNVLDKIKTIVMHDELSIIDHMDELVIKAMKR